MQKEHLTPLAILGGAVVIALAVYAGLRERSTTAASSSPSAAALEAPPAEATPPASAPAPASANPAPVIPVMKVRSELEALLAAEKRTRFVPSCWKPALDKTPQPAASTYSIEISVNEQGVEVGRGISELRDKDSRGDVAECLRRQPIGLKVSPPGANVTLSFLMSFP